MPLPIAHGLVGASVVALIHPNADLKNWKPLIFGFILANCSDFDFAFSFLFGWRNFHRGITHSLLFAFFVSALIFILLRHRNWRVWTAYSAAFLSHTILDYLCGKSGAVCLLMPFDNHPYSLGLISFSEITRGFIIQDLLYFSLIEFAVFAPIFLVIILLNTKVNEKRREI